MSIDHSITIPDLPDANNTENKGPNVRWPKPNWTIHDDFEESSPPNSLRREADGAEISTTKSITTTTQASPTTALTEFEDVDDNDNNNSTEDNYYAEWFNEKEIKINDSLRVIPRSGTKSAKINIYTGGGGSSGNRNDSDAECEFFF